MTSLPSRPVNRLYHSFKPGSWVLSLFILFLFEIGWYQWNSLQMCEEDLSCPGFRMGEIKGYWSQCIPSPPWVNNQMNCWGKEKFEGNVASPQWSQVPNSVIAILAATHQQVIDWVISIETTKEGEFWILLIQVSIPSRLYWAVQYPEYLFYGYASIHVEDSLVCYSTASRAEILS